MSAKLKVNVIVKPGDRRKFLRLIAQPSTTVNIAHRWLLDKGYVISRNAVWNFTRKRPPQLGTDADCRRKLAAWSKELSGKNLEAVTIMACILAGRWNGQKGTDRTLI